MGPRTPQSGRDRLSVARTLVFAGRTGVRYTRIMPLDVSPWCTAVLVSSLAAVGPVVGCGSDGAEGAGDGSTTDTSVGSASAVATSASATATTDTDPVGEASSGSTGAGPSPQIYGVTIDAIEPLDEIVDALAHLHHRPTTRVVFDEFVPASDYVDAVAEIAAVSDVMGEILDSYYVAQYSPAQYRMRAQEYVDAMADTVTIWEVGNEINGEWLCAPDAESCTAAQTVEVVEKMQAAFDVVRAAGGQAALTLYYNEDCWSQPEHEMFTWQAANVPAAMREGLDYVFVSYYEDDCNGLQPDWPAVFEQLATAFPNARLGIGECGTLDPIAKAAFVQRYYGMAIEQPAFVGGWFWWYFLEDMVPRDRALWGVLDQALAP